MEAEPFIYNIVLSTLEYSADFYILGVVVLVLLIVLSALVSGSEVAFFSLSPTDKSRLSVSQNALSKVVIKLLSKPHRLLATILVTNNFINIAIIIISAYITRPLFDFIDSDILIILFQLVIISSVLFLFGELLPKILAGKFQLSFTRFMAIPLVFAGKVFYPISILLVKSTKIVNKKLEKYKSDNISLDDLSDAIQLASDDLKDEKDILEGIVNFSNLEVKEIMTPRTDIFALEYNESFKEVIDFIVDSVYSRIPVYKDTIDNIRGVLYIKDVLPYLKKKGGKDIEWQKIIREQYIVPETKKISDLLNDFKTKKIHMAIVIDEYGGVSGIITLEDVLEEIVGEIEDETDIADDYYKKINDNEYEFNAKVSLIDFCKLLEIDYNIFDEVKGESDTLAGLILELKGDIPDKNEVILFNKFEFTVSVADKRRIKKLKIKIKNDSENN